MLHSVRTIFALGALISVAGMALANDFYPSLPPAKSAIDFDSCGFLIHGQRTWISSAGIEYARVPRALWRDRLLKIKRAGFNCIEIYAFWNYHEISPGRWNFSGDKDVGAFLDLAHELGLYATVRVGPYVCAEWENGGFPNWLRFVPGLRMRQDEPQYLAAVDAWYDQILPIVASRQISRGGGVIMVQLENEDDEGWGAWDLDPVHQAYFKNLLDSARRHGIEVPTFFSGMNHGGDPAPKDPISSENRSNPWYTTEYWSGWYNQYGNFLGGDADALTHFDRAAWRFLENGAQGFNVYMFHGGTNFDHWNNNEVAASYDYAGAIGQAGDLRPIYYKYKRVAMFARSFQAILEDCGRLRNPPADTPYIKGSFPGLVVTDRRALEFLDNPGSKPVNAKFADGQVLTLAPGEITCMVRTPFFVRHPKTGVGPFCIESSECRILGIAEQGLTSTVVIYGSPGSTGRISFGTASAGEMITEDQGAGWKGGDLAVTFHDGAPEVNILSSGIYILRVIAMSSEMADKTYFVEGKDGTYVITGSPFIGEFQSPSHFNQQLPITANVSPAITIYEPDGSQRMAGPPNQTETSAEPLPSIDLTAPALTDWQSASAIAEASPDFSVTGWFDGRSGAQAVHTKDGAMQPICDPPAMGSDGGSSAYAWYRAKVHAFSAGTKYLQIPFVGDQAYVFLNGVRVSGTFGPGPVQIPLALTVGDNSLAILVSHNGRTKLIGTYGAIDHLDVKGLVGPVMLLPAASPQLSLGDIVAQDWWKDHPPIGQLVDPKLDTSDSKWSHTNMHANFGGQSPGTWRSPFVCLRATLPELAGPNRVLHVGMYDEKAVFYLNGQKIGEGVSPNFTDQPASLRPYIPPHDFPIDFAWKDGGPNVLAILLENSHAQATVGMITLTSGDPGVLVADWKMRGGLTPLTSPGLRWQSAPTSAPGVPTYYRARFTVPANFLRGVVPVLRLSSQGMSRGFAWLNGHALGRYPEKVPVDGLWLPECWLKPGANELVILDEEGAAIAPEHLWIEESASRRVVTR